MYGCCWSQKTLGSDKVREAERIRWEILRQDEHRTLLSGPALVVPAVGVGVVDLRRTTGVFGVAVAEQTGSDMDGNKTQAERAAK